MPAGLVNLVKSFALSKLMGSKGDKKLPEERQKLARNFIDPPASQQTVDVEAQTVGVETIGNVPQPFTQVPELDMGVSTGTGIAGIVEEIQRLNRNIMAIGDAMMATALIESDYRKNVEEDLQQAIADRDKDRSQNRSKTRRDTIGKKITSKLSKPVTSFAKAGAGSLALELMAAATGADDIDKDDPTKPQGSSRGVASLIDYMSGGLTDFDKRGKGNFNLFNPLGGGDDSKWGETDGGDKDKNQWWDFLNMFDNKPKGQSSSSDVIESSIENNSSKTTNNISNSSSNISGDTEGNLTLNVGSKEDIIAGVKESVGKIEPREGDVTVIDQRTKKAIDNVGKKTATVSGGNVVPDGDPGRSGTYEAFARRNERLARFVN